MIEQFIIVYIILINCPVSCIYIFSQLAHITKNIKDFKSSPTASLFLKNDDKIMFILGSSDKRLNESIEIYEYKPNLKVFEFVDFADMNEMEDDDKPHSPFPTNFASSQSLDSYYVSIPKRYNKYDNDNILFYEIRVNFLKQKTLKMIKRFVVVDNLQEENLKFVIGSNMYYVSEIGKRSLYIISGKYFSSQIFSEQLIFIVVLFDRHGGDTSTYKYTVDGQYKFSQFKKDLYSYKVEEKEYIIVTSCTDGNITTLLYFRLNIDSNMSMSLIGTYHYTDDKFDLLNYFFILPLNNAGRFATVRYTESQISIFNVYLRNPHIYKL